MLTKIMKTTTKKNFIAFFLPLTKSRARNYEWRAKKCLRNVKSFFSSFICTYHCEIGSKLKSENQEEKNLNSINCQFYIFFFFSQLIFTILPIEHFIQLRFFFVHRSLWKIFLFFLPSIKEIFYFIICDFLFFRVVVLVLQKLKQYFIHFANNIFTHQK